MDQRREAILVAQMKVSGENEGETGFSTQEQSNQEDSFVWDQTSQLYYHARSGFYHDPNAGWYYSTGDGLYYKFEDGKYVQLDSYTGDESEVKGQGETAISEAWTEATYDRDCDQNNQENEGQCVDSELPESHPPPSEWLEDTLIELYLSGYSNVASNAADDILIPKETDERDSSLMSADGNIEFHGQGDGESNLDHQAATDTTASVYEGESYDEERWRAQYGQVVQPEDELGPGFPVVDIWDWLMVKEIEKEGNPEVGRIVGRLVQPSSKLHPSMPSGGVRFRTAPICSVHLDLVQVRSGQVYKLRSPNVQYLATLSSFNASNPTKDWGFPELSVETTSESFESKTALPFLSEPNTHSCASKPSVYAKHKSHAYRDRAAERRALHGEFSVAPRQKKSDDDSIPSSVEEAAAEALDMSFGAASYAHKILKSMGWKEGEALGKTQQGLTKPLEGVGNKGTAGLGWDSRGSR